MDHQVDEVDVFTSLLHIIILPPSSRKYRKADCAKQCKEGITTLLLPSKMCSRHHSHRRVCQFTTVSRSEMLDLYEASHCQQTFSPSGFRIKESGDQACTFTLPVAPPPISPTKLIVEISMAEASEEVAC